MLAEVECILSTPNYPLAKFNKPSLNWSMELSKPTVASNYQRKERLKPITFHTLGNMETLGKDQREAGSNTSFEARLELF